MLIKMLNKGSAWVMNSFAIFEVIFDLKGRNFESSLKGYFQTLIIAEAI